MKILEKFRKVISGMAIVALTVPMLFMGATPVFAAVGPIIDEQLSVNPDSGTATNFTPEFRIHATDSFYELVSCTYRYKSSADAWTGWLSGTYSADTDNPGNPIFGSGSCFAYPDTSTLAAPNIEVEMGVANSSGITTYTTSSIIRDLSTSTPIVTVNPVTTDTLSLPIVSGSIDDPSAYVTVIIHNDDYSVYSVIYPTNNGDGTWNGSAIDYLSAGMYTMDIIADNMINQGYTTGTYTVNPVLAASYTLTYTAGANGLISGNTAQSVSALADGTTVTAVPNTGYHFTSWSDGVLTAARTDLFVSADISVTAYFASNTPTTTPTITVSGSPATVLSGATVPADFTYTITNDTASPYSIGYWWMSISNIRKSGIKTFNYVDGPTVTPITVPNETCDWMGNCRLEIFSLPVNTPTLAVGQTVSFHFQIAFDNASPTVAETHGIFLGAVNGAMTQFSDTSASFTVNNPVVMYDATFNVDGVLTVVPTDFGAAIAVPADPTKTGYTFDGWLPLVPETMPANDVTFVAQWTVNSYDATFNVDGVLTVVPTDFGAAIAVPADPTKTGYTFDGWSPAIPSTMASNNATFVAQWVANTAPIPTPITPAASSGNTTVAQITDTTSSSVSTGEVAGVSTDNTTASTPSGTTVAGNSEDVTEVKGDTDSPTWWNTTVMGIARWLWALLAIAAVAAFGYWWLVLGKRTVRK